MYTYVSLRVFCLCVSASRIKIKNKKQLKQTVFCYTFDGVALFTLLFDNIPTYVCSVIPLHNGRNRDSRLKTEWLSEKGLPMPVFVIHNVCRQWPSPLLLLVFATNLYSLRFPLGSLCRDIIAHLKFAFIRMC